MDEQELVRRYPRLFHMAAAGSWPSIRDHGLLTTQQIVESSGLPPEARRTLLVERRASSAELAHPVLGPVTIRDQGPLRTDHLRQALTDMTEGEWLTALSDRVFFWLHPRRLETLRRARRYRHLQQDVLTVDTAAVLERHRASVRLSPINSGATLWPGAAPRGSGTFQTIGDYDFHRRRRGRGDAGAIAELVVLDGVPDVVETVVSVDRWRGPELLRHLAP